MQGMEQVLQNINRLNRNLESVISVCPSIGLICPIQFNTSLPGKRKSKKAYLTNQVGNEFGSVEALWSQFENFMGRPQEEVEQAHGSSGGSGQKEEQDEGETEVHQ